MSNFYNKISSVIADSDFIKNFDAVVQTRTTGASVHNLNRSAKSLLLARAFAISGLNVVFITADDKMAEDYLEDLDLLLGHDSAYFLPDYEVLPYEQRSPHYLIRAQRIETLTAAVSVKPAVFTVSTHSFLRKIVAHDIFGNNIITLKKGMDFNPDVLVSDLVGMGYENQFQVSKVGELARRGGIIDVFCPSLHKPVRVEFFGDEVESIRVFSVSSQRSTGEELESVTLIPSREFSLHDIDTSEPMWQRIHKNGFYDGIELDVALLLPKIEPFLNYFDANNCLVFWDEFQFFQTSLNEILSETAELYQKVHSQYKKRILPQPEDIFASEEYINRVFRDFPNFFLNGSFQDFKQATKILQAPVTSQVNLQGSLELLEQELATKLEDGYRIVVQSDNKSQSKRMQDLLPQFENKMDFTIGVLQKGFNLTDAKLAIFTDHEIFSRYKRKRRQTQFSKEEALVDYESLKPGDYIVHIDHGIGVYAGLNKLQVDGNIIECL
ncbi:MAG TPA: CarD family transcriptional regulator, partial [Candidatus Cloacimonadota bacterium]|nr:CarD family transcriptional regulator [Candidatus Cloacimonadota bacterium]